MLRSVSSLYVVCAPSSQPKNFVTSPGGRCNEDATSTIFGIAVLMPLPRPSTLPMMRGIL